MLLPPAVLAPLAGSYATPDRSDAFAIRLRDGRLWLHPAGGSSVQLLPGTARTFFIREAPLEIEFGTGEPPQQLFVQRDGQALLYRRLP